MNERNLVDALILRTMSAILVHKKLIKLSTLLSDCLDKTLSLNFVLFYVHVVRSNSLVRVDTKNEDDVCDRRA